MKIAHYLIASKLFIWHDLIKNNYIHTFHSSLTIRPFGVVDVNRRSACRGVPVIHTSVFLVCFRWWIVIKAGFECWPWWWHISSRRGWRLFSGHNSFLTVRKLSQFYHAHFFERWFSSQFGKKRFYDGRVWFWIALYGWQVWRCRGKSV